MVMRCATPDAYKLFHDGTVALAQVESNGIRIDVPYLERTTKEVTEKVRSLTAACKESDVWVHWCRRFGKAAKFGSSDQLMEVLVKDEGVPEPPRSAKSKKYKADEATLDRIDHPFAKSYIEIRKYNKVLGTYLGGIARETCDGFLHPSFNLAGGNADDDGVGGAQTYRSSSSSPNFQNMPVRDPVQGKLIRQTIISRFGLFGRILEFDFKGIEVGISVCYNDDPVLRRYVEMSRSCVPEDKRTDMHRDMAAQLYMVNNAQVSKAMRHRAKNMFVFPEFYGSFYVDCARDIWEDTLRGDRRTKDGVDLFEHFKGKGIHALGKCDPEHSPQPGTYEYHVKKVEDDFWNRRFKVYTAWKKRWYRQYLIDGGFYLKTGFYIQGDYRRNQVLNYPIQGAAFHCLLWCLIRLQRWMNSKRMKSKIIGQIHDSMIVDAHESELEAIVTKAQAIMREDLPAEWDWITVPLEVEVEAAKPGESWHDKKPLAI